MRKLLPRRLLPLLVFGLSVFAVQVVPAAAADKLTPQAAEVLVRESGLADQLPSIAPSVAAGLTLNPGFASNLSEDQLQIVLKAFANAYAPLRLSADISAELAGQLKPAAAQESLAWFQSELGRKITALEDTASKSASDSTAMEQAQELYQRLPPRRAERYEKLAKASGVAESSAQLLINTSAGTAYGVASTTGAASPPNLDEIRDEYARNRAEMTEALRIQFIVLFASAYQSLPETELDQYIAFVESPSGQAFHKAMAVAIDRAMVKATKEAGKQVGEAVRLKKAQTPA